MNIEIKLKNLLKDYAKKGTKMRTSRYLYTFINVLSVLYIKFTFISNYISYIITILAGNNNRKKKERKTKNR